MASKILDGKKIAEQRQKTLVKLIIDIKSNGWHIPTLAVILIGSDPASTIYVNKKRETCKIVGINSKNYDLDNSISESDLLKLIDTLNKDPLVDGILIQLPLPKHINTNKVIDHILSLKDVDGFHPYNLGKLMQNDPVIRPCTPLGIINLLTAYKLDNLIGLNATIIGTSNIVGKPLCGEFLNKGCTVTLCNKNTKNLSDFVNNADILVSAIGKPHFIKTDWIKPNAIVIDVGISRLENGQIVGDIDFDTAKDVASWITPVPGGIGPMTVISLLENTLYIADKLLKRYP